MINRILSAACGLLCASQIWCITPDEFRFHNEHNDTTIINNVLERLSGSHDINPSKVAIEFIDTPYKGGTLEASPETLTINMEEFDCTTFAETVLALTLTLKEHRVSWRDFAYNLRQLRYRNGEVNGYPSRLHYMSDWVIDNSHRGLVKDATNEVGNAQYEVKTLDFMSRNAGLYPQLSDAENLQGIKDREIGYRSHRYPYIRPLSFGSAKFRDGDLLLLTSKKDGLDVSHVGFIVMKNGIPHLLHASSKEGKVVIDKLSLSDYFKRSKGLSGVRVIRLTD